MTARKRRGSQDSLDLAYAIERIKHGLLMADLACKHSTREAAYLLYAAVERQRPLLKRLAGNLLRR